MKYLCLIYANEQTLQGLDATASSQLVEECEAHTRQLAAAGQYLGGEKLQPASNSTCIRVRNGRPMVTDGPFVETKEQLGGFYLIDARDLNEAIRIAWHIPGARIGTVEIRPVEP